MSLAELLPIAGAMTAPAFFLIFALASLGAPLLALLCLAVAQLRSTQYIEAYARRLLRMALTAALPALLAFAAVVGLAVLKAPWLPDWLEAAPLAPGLLAVLIMAFTASLITLRQSRPQHGRRSRQSRPLAQAFVLSLLALGILWLTLAVTHGILEQAQSMLRMPESQGLTMAPLLTPDISTLPPLFWTALAALVPLCIACSATMSLEYMLLLRDRDPFGREALTQMLRIAARSALRSTLLATAMLPVLWAHLPEMPALPNGALLDGNLPARVMLGLAGACAALLCLSAAAVSRSSRPWARPFAIHLATFFVWLGLTALLCVALISFYAS